MESACDEGAGGRGIGGGVGDLFGGGGTEAAADGSGCSSPPTKKSISAAENPSNFILFRTACSGRIVFILKYGANRGSSFDIDAEEGVNTGGDGGIVEGGRGGGGGLAEEMGGAEGAGGGGSREGGGAEDEEDENVADVGA